MKKTTHNLKGCRCPEGSDIRFCLGVIIKNKYRNKKTTNAGIEFHSEAESARYDELLLLEKGGEIDCITLQPKFLLQGSFKDRNGKTHRKIEYIADFKYRDIRYNHPVVEDVKGMKTEIYKIKKKLFLKKYGEKYIFLETY